MAETLLSPSNILLYGRVVDDLSIHESAHGGPSHSPFIVPRAGGDRDLEHQLTAANAAIARIYSFSYEGAYYDLPRPALFLVHGQGLLVTTVSPKNGEGVGAPIVPLRQASLPYPAWRQPIFNSPTGSGYGPTTRLTTPSGWMSKLVNSKMCC